MERIRLMHVIQDLHIGGLERVVITLCRTLDRSRFDVSVLCLRGAGPLAAELEAMGVPVVDIGGEPGTPDYFAFRKVARELRERRIDVVHTHNTLALFDGFIGSAMAKVKTLVHTDHARPFPDKPRYMLAENLISRFIYRIAAVSEHTRENLLRYEKISPEKVVTIPNGIAEVDATSAERAEAKRSELGLTGTGPVIGLGARLTKQKGVIYLLQAMVPLRERFPDLTLLIAGSGEEEEQLKAAAAELDLGESVRFLGPRLDLPELLPLFDVYVLPSIWEGLPMALLEAMAARCPIVATEVGGMPGAIEHGVNGTLVPPQDPEALATEIGRLLADPAQRARYAEAARQTYESRYSADAMTRQYEDLYLRRAG